MASSEPGQQRTPCWRNSRRRPSRPSSPHVTGRPRLQSGRATDRCSGANAPPSNSDDPRIGRAPAGAEGPFLRSALGRYTIRRRGWSRARSQPASRQPTDRWARCSALQSDGRSAPIGLEWRARSGGTRVGDADRGRSIRGAAGRPCRPGRDDRRSAPCVREDLALRAVAVHGKRDATACRSDDRWGGHFMGERGRSCCTSTAMTGRPWRLPRIIGRWPHRRRRDGCGGTGTRMQAAPVVLSCFSIGPCSST